MDDLPDLQKSPQIFKGREGDSPSSRAWDTSDFSSLIGKRSV